MMLQLRNGDEEVEAEELDPSAHVQILIGDDFFNSDGVCRLQRRSCGSAGVARIFAAAPRGRTFHCAG